jgi:serine-type D-Ala-D-Ala carboxypeptidase/endopeptidase (penicillin-binding protein 4)
VVGQHKYPPGDVRSAWAARTIFRRRQAHFLDSSGPPSKNGIAVTRRSLVVVLLLALASPVAAGAQETPLQARLAKALRVPHVAPGRSAAVATDLATGTVAFAQNPTLPLAPASNEKLPLTFAALSNLGPSYRIETDVLGEGSQDGTTFDGTLVLKGGGDPTLSTTGLRSLALQVRTAGIRHVTGGVVGDESYFDSRRTVAGWKPSFYVNESPPLSALSVNRSLARAPALAAATTFRSVLRSAGITIDGGVSVGRVEDFSIPLAQVDSPPLASIIRFMDKESDNFTAELVLKQLGAVVLDRGTSAAGASVVMQTLAEAGVPVTGVRIVDGSGLSQLDRLTANAVAAILRAAWNDPAVRPAFVASLPVAGMNGTLQDRLRQPATRGRVLAKTGTTSIASALSGYVNTRYVFTVLQNGHPLSYWWARRAQDRFVEVLARE